jgi:replication factor C small subunit
MLTGSAGVGKTTVAKAMCDEIGINHLYINASENRGIDMLRTTIRGYASTVSLTGGQKVIILDEADYLTQEAQASMRGVMEEFHSTARFILTCNKPHMIMDALKSRCQQFHFEKIDQTEFTARVATILVTEEIDFDLDKLDAYVSSTNPDLRKCINLVQQNCNNGVLAEPNTADAGDMEWKFRMVDLFKAKKYQEARKLVCGKLRAEEIEEMYRLMYDNISLFGNDDVQDSAVLVIKQGLVDHFVVVDPEINLAATMVRLARLNK